MQCMVTCKNALLLLIRKFFSFSVREILQLFFGHGFFHLFGRAFKAGLIPLTPFCCECSSGRHLLFLRFCRHINGSACYSFAVVDNREFVRAQSTWRDDLLTIIDGKFTSPLKYLFQKNKVSYIKL